MPSQTHSRDVTRRVSRPRDPVTYTRAREIHIKGNIRSDVVELYGDLKVSREAAARDF